MTYITKDSGKRVKFESGFNRDLQEGKPRYDLIPHEMLKRLADLYSRGAVKYGENNWRLAKDKVELDRFKASAFRHFMQWFSNSDIEEDHASAIIFNVMSFEWHTKHKQDEKKKTDKKR